jgi:sulfhydrogenase subunit delta
VSVEPCRRPRLAVFRLTSCGGCQSTLLRSDGLSALAREMDIVRLSVLSGATSRGPFDLALVEGAITSPGDAQRIRDVRRWSRVLVALGACATEGGLTALRRAACEPLARYVPVDLELRGCPVDGSAIASLLAAFLVGRDPRMPSYSLCQECKRHGVTCLLVARGLPCLGPVTRAGCGAICPTHGRGCYGCFGPMESPNPTALATVLERLNRPHL